MATGLRIALYHNLPSGGAKRTVAETVSRLARRHRVDLFTLASADRSFCDVGPYVAESVTFPFQAGRLLPSPFGRLNQAVRLLDLWRVECFARRIAAAVDRRGYDVALVHPCVVTQAPSPLFYLRTPSVYYCHEPLRALHEPAIPRPCRRETRYRRALDRLDPLNRAYRSLLGRLDRRNLRSASLVLTNSSYTREAIRRIYGVVAEVNRVGVDAAAFRPLGIPREHLVISAGALKPEKGFDFVIASLGTIPPPRRPALSLVSNAEVPGERAYLERLAERWGVRVTFRMGVSDDELVRLYNTALLTTYAPVREPLGLVALESQACQTPVVAVAEGGVPETVVHGRTGLLVDRDAAEFARAVGSLLADGALLDRYGREGRAHVREQWSWESSVAGLEVALLRAAGRGREALHTPTATGWASLERLG